MNYITGSNNNDHVDDDSDGDNNIINNYIFLWLQIIIVMSRMHDNRWTKRCIEWQPREGKRNRGKASEKMERRYRGHGRKDMGEKDERQRGVAMLFGGLCSAVD